MEVDGFNVAPEDCGRRIVLIGKTREALEGTYAGQYVAWGEEKKVHQGRPAPPGRRRSGRGTI